MRFDPGQHGSAKRTVDAAARSSLTACRSRCKERESPASATRCPTASRRAVRAPPADDEHLDGRHRCIISAGSPNAMCVFAIDIPNCCTRFMIRLRISFENESAASATSFSAEDRCLISSLERFVADSDAREAAAHPFAISAATSAARSAPSEPSVATECSASVRPFKQGIPLARIRRLCDRPPFQYPACDPATAATRMAKKPPSRGPGSDATRLPFVTSPLNPAAAGPWEARWHRRTRPLPRSRIGASPARASRCSLTSSARARRGLDATVGIDPHQHSFVEFLRALRRTPERVPSHWTWSSSPQH